MSIKCLDHRKCDMSVKRLLGFLFYSLVAMYVQAQVSETKYNYETVAKDITAGCSTKMEQAEAIYKWLCRNIAYDTEYKIYTADECWEEKKGVCLAYCELFYRLAEPLGLKTTIIVGKSKDSDGNVGKIGHAWLQVLVDDGLILVDPTWGAGSVNDGVFTRSENDMSWFWIDPHFLIFTHFPDEARYQYLSTPIDWETFLALPSLKPVLQEYGLAGKPLLEGFLKGTITSFPTIYRQYGEDLFLKEFPMQSVLRPGRYYTFKVGKTSDRVLALVHEGEFIEEKKWDVEDNCYVLTYMPTSAGKLQLSVKTSDNQYSPAVEFTVAAPIREELKVIEQEYPFRMPEMKNVKGIDAERMSLVGFDGHKVLQEVRRQNLKSVLTLYADAEMFLREVDVPIAQDLQIGKSYTFSFRPIKGTSWAIFNEGDCYKEWALDRDTGWLTMTVVPTKSGSLNLSVQLPNGKSYRGILGYTVK